MAPVVGAVEGIARIPEGKLRIRQIVLGATIVAVAAAEVAKARSAACLSASNLARAIRPS